MAGMLGGFWSVLDLVPNAVIALIVVLGAIAVSHHALTIGGLVAFITLGPAAGVAGRGARLHPRLRRGGRHRRAAGAGDLRHRPRSRTITDEEPFHCRTGPPSSPGRPPALRACGLLLSRQHGQPVLRDVDLERGARRDAGARRGDRVGQDDAAAAGAAAGGHDRRPGAARRHRRAGHPARRSCARAVGCAFEEATLFSASVRENVTFGAADATDDEIEAALTAAQARFAYDLPWGLDTRIGEQGMALSGGQRQRVALARAILARPRGADPRRPAVGARRAHRGAGDHARWARSWPGSRRSSSRTGRPRSRSPTGSRCSTAG